MKLFFAASASAAIGIWLLMAFGMPEGQPPAARPELSVGAGASDCIVERKVDDAQCGELCLDSTVAYLAEKFGGVSKGSCAEIGYTIFDHEEKVSMGPLGESTVTVYTEPPSLGASDCVVERKVDDADGTCGELCLDASIASLAEKFGGVSKGSCAEIGYTIFDHEETVSMGPLGESTVTVYTEPLALAADDCVVERKVDGASCGELCLSSAIAPFAEKFGGVEEGECAELGYDQFDHEESVDMGPFGSSAVKVYIKSSAVTAPSVASSF
ncbi:hypothetical protein TeGR_g6854 [Tetraparma gracilis]|jgi:hypothetical protein|uniref:Uncharacterized protein n=1 Tax=Tetraparma gracilis TaxID=2962635 RepID=A0ABQ6N213_9STRA|nr:hypothetical protein TeGR_g6854 [Tetraparma gracilis]